MSDGNTQGQLRSGGGLIQRHLESGEFVEVDRPRYAQLTERDGGSGTPGAV